YQFADFQFFESKPYAQYAFPLNEALTHILLMKLLLVLVDHIQHYEKPSGLQQFQTKKNLLHNITINIVFVYLSINHHNNPSTNSHVVSFLNVMSYYFSNNPLHKP